MRRAKFLKVCQNSAIPQKTTCGTRRRECNLTLATTLRGARSQRGSRAEQQCTYESCITIWGLAPRKISDSAGSAANKHLVTTPSEALTHDRNKYRTTVVASCFPRSACTCLPLVYRRHFWTVLHVCNLSVSTSPTLRKH